MPLNSANSAGETASSFAPVKGQAMSPNRRSALHITKNESSAKAINIKTGYGKGSSLSPLKTTFFNYTPSSHFKHEILTPLKQLFYTNIYYNIKSD